MAVVIGLTGGIASGKSTASYILKDLGAIIIDADKIARDMVKIQSPALFEIKDYFGEKVILEDGTLDRKKLGSIVFNDKNLLKKLNNITHPYIIKEIINEINWYKKIYKDGVIILDSALLIEMKLTYLVDEVWLISIPKNMQIDRLTQRENISIEDAKKRINSQMSVKEKKKYANKIIDNTKDIHYLRMQLEENFKNIG